MSAEYHGAVWVRPTAGQPDHIAGIFQQFHYAGPIVRETGSETMPIFLSCVCQNKPLVPFCADWCPLTADLHWCTSVCAWKPTKCLSQGVMANMECEFTTKSLRSCAHSNRMKNPLRVLPTSRVTSSGTVAGSPSLRLSVQ